ncbi:MAG TPA: hypothetical protein VJ827_11985 [Rubrobacter sp.]|nr:hypothetical protein [Rubrobacter sp.]
MYGIEELEIPRLHREEVAREVRLSRISGARRPVGGSGVLLELKRDFGLLLKLFQVVRS